jgi:hypothetical protein
MSKLSEFRELVSEIDNVETLSSAYDVVSDVLKITSMRQEIKKLESTLTEGGKAMFYYFAMGLDDEELPYAAEKISGKIKRLMRKKEEDDASEKEEEGSDD